MTHFWSSKSAATIAFFFGRLHTCTGGVLERARGPDVASLGGAALEEPDPCTSNEEAPAGRIPSELLVPELFADIPGSVRLFYPYYPASLNAETQMRKLR